LSRYKQILNEVVANMNSIIEYANTRPSARRKAEKQRAECKENLQDLLVAEILQAYALSTKPKKRNTKDHIMHHLLRQKLLFLILLKEYLLFRCRSHSKASSSAKQLLKSCTSLLFFNRIFFAKLRLRLFHYHRHTYSVYLQLKVLFTLGLSS
jgi:hypothetical protein